MNKLVPPRSKWKTDIFIYVILLILSFIWSTRVFRNNLEIVYNVPEGFDGIQKNALWFPFGEKIKDYYYLFFTDWSKHPIRLKPFLDYFKFSHTFIFSTVFFLYCVFAIFRNYLSMNNGAKSMYLLNRLPSRINGHFRCLFLPLAAFVTGMVFTALLAFEYSRLFRFLDLKLTFNIWEALL